MLIINLLPYRDALDRYKKVAELRYIGAAVLILALAVAGIYLGLEKTTAHLQQETAAGRAELEFLDKRIGMIKELKKLQEEAEKRRTIIAELSSHREDGAQRLRGLAFTLPSGCWLTKYQENATQASVGGMATDEAQVAQFATTLAAVKPYRQTDLQLSEQTTFNNRIYKHFELQAVFGAAAPAATPGAKR